MSDPISITHLYMLADLADASEPGCWYDVGSLDLETFNDARLVEACSPAVIMGLTRYIDDLQNALFGAAGLAVRAGHRDTAEQWNELIRKGPTK